MNIIEVSLFITSVVGVIWLGIRKSRNGKEEGNAADYFLAGRGLTWWLVGFSLIAANISTEQLVGNTGLSANWLGMAVASYEWIAAITLVVVAFWFLPRFLRAGLYTIPEFLEYRFGTLARVTMAILTIFTLVLVTTSSVIFSGGKFVSEYYNEVPILNNLTIVCWFIAGFAAFYVFIGGLKACAWTDLVWGGSLILGAVIVLWMAMSEMATRPASELILTKVANSDATVEDIDGAGGWRRFILLNDGVDGEATAVSGGNLSGGKIHMARPKEDPEIPWTALLLGLWIPNFYYWGLNQFIVQRTLGSKSLAEGQKGLVFAAFLKMLIPFIVVIPGILAFNLFQGDLMTSTGEYDYDKAFPVLVRNLIKPHPFISWFVLAALCGAVISSLAAMLNSASTIATMDLYATATKEKDTGKLVGVGRVFVLIFALLGAMVAPFLNSLDSIFSYIQEFQGFISPGVLAVFILGFFSPKTPRFMGWFGILLNAVSYGLIKWGIGPAIVSSGWWFSSEITFLDRMGICFIAVMTVGLVATMVKPLPEPVTMPFNDRINLTSSPLARTGGIVVCVLVVMLYVIFW